MQRTLPSRREAAVDLSAPPLGIVMPKMPLDGGDDKYAKMQTSSSGAGAGATSRYGGDYGAIGLLMLLYTLQGVPMGLAGSVPLLMQGKVSDSEQAAFSIVSW